MKTLRGTSLTSEMCLDRQMMEDTLPLGFVTLQRNRGTEESYLQTISIVLEQNFMVFTYSLDGNQKNFYNRKK